MSQESPALARAIEILADGEWHDMAEVLLAAMAHVEPSKAIRKAERVRANSLRKRGKDPKQARRRPRDRWELQQFGARCIARECIVKSPRFEVQWLDRDGNWVSQANKAPRYARARIRRKPGYVWNARGTSPVKADYRVELIELVTRAS